MAGEEYIDSIVTPRWNPKFRKRKKHDGMAIDGELAEQLDALRPLVDSGLFCTARCRKWIPWKKIAITYELRNGDVMRLWWCECDNLLQEEKIQ